MKKEIVTTLGIILFFFTSAYAGQVKELIGDKSDGSRAIPLHLIPLFAENEKGQKGEQIKSDSAEPLPFSIRFSCGECHSYETIRQGWHFNAGAPDQVGGNSLPGRAGEPWIYFDSRLGIQIPLSYRSWPGAFRPQELGLSAFQFTKIFGRHFPGGGSGEVQAAEISEIGRQFISGKLEINCLACHNAHYGQDMGSVNGYAVQVSRENFRWAAAASCEFASVTGSAEKMSQTWDPWMPDPDVKGAPTVSYRKEAFNDSNEVLLQIVREVPNERCYYCHSDLYYSNTEKTEKWSSDEDVHLAAGLKCVDCHRNGIDHNIVRGYSEEAGISQNPLAATSSCEGCHLAESKEQPQPTRGRLGAPVPKHSGIPPVHLKKLTCTACHSGPWPSGQTVLTKTSRAHRLGTPNVNKDEKVLPHIISPVFAGQPPRGGKITPYKIIWPAYWAVQENDNIKLIELAVTEKVVRRIFADLELFESGSWPEITEQKIIEALKLLGTAVKGKAGFPQSGGPVYVAGGSLYKLDNSGQLAEEVNHPAAAPYMWPIAHNVRPAAQSLGAAGCEDCHSPEAPFFYGKVWIDSPVQGKGSVFREMMDMYKVDGPVYVRVNLFFKLLIIVVMTLLILHIMGDLFRRVMNKIKILKNQK